MLTHTNKFAEESKLMSTGLSGDTVTGVANGTSIDREALLAGNGPYQTGTLVVELEALTGSPTAVDIKHHLEHSDDNSTFTAITDTSVVSAATLDFTEVGIKTLTVRMPSLKRYVRARRGTVTLTGGTSPKAKLRSLFILTEGRQV